jgi:hypothetical protein
MNISNNESSLLRRPQIDDIKCVGRIVHIDSNVVGRYAHFSRLYNCTFNIVDNIAYKVPDLKTKKYKLFRFTSYLIIPIVLLWLPGYSYWSSYEALNEP